MLLLPYSHVVFPADKAPHNKMYEIEIEIEISLLTKSGSQEGIYK
jgi:hypothetical protein